MVGNGTANEFLGVDLDALPFQVTEAAGELHVWYRSVLRDAWPWHTHGHVDERGGLHILDLVRGRWVKTYEAGSWDQVTRRPAPLEVPGGR